MKTFLIEYCDAIHIINAPNRRRAAEMIHRSYNSYPDTDTISKLAYHAVKLSSKTKGYRILNRDDLTLVEP